MKEAFARVTELLAQHFLLALAALLLGLAVSLPLVVLSSRNRMVARIALGFASLVQTIPSLALLALWALVGLAAVFGFVAGSAWYLAGAALLVIVLADAATGGTG